MRLDRLRDTAVATRNAEHFDIRSWCGTACCAVGNYVLAHPESELKVHDIPFYRGIDGYAAVMRFYEITFDHMGFLFLPEAYPLSVRQDALYVASRIEQFCRDHQPVIEMKADAPAPVAALGESL